MAPSTEYLRADLADARHAEWITLLTNEYAQDPMGNGEPLPADVLRELVPGLRAQPTALVFLALVEGEPAGIATCFGGFSTFKARPLINVHDVFVRAAYRGRGIASGLLKTVEAHALETGCCKLTLEVLENNRTARRVYESQGFGQAVYTEAAGGALFYVKPLG
jgi:GNAT superfamily N-acetyltransferase